MRNDEMRLIAESDMPPQKTPTTTPPPQLPDQAMSWVMPTCFVQLPSCGRFYAPDHPLYNRDVVEIYEMGTKDLDILANQSYQEQGVTLDRLLQRLLVDKSIDSRSLISGDRGAILIAARISGRGAEYKTHVMCRVCQRPGSANFDLSKAELLNSDDAEDYDVERTADGTFVAVLPRSRAKIEFRVTTGFDELQEHERKKSLKRRQKKLKHVPSQFALDADDTPFVDQIRSLIVSVNGNKDRSFVNMVAENMHLMDSSYLLELYDKVAPGILVEAPFCCEHCKFQDDIAAPITVDFFFPRN